MKTQELVRRAIVARSNTKRSRQYLVMAAIAAAVARKHAKEETRLALARFLLRKKRAKISAAHVARVILAKAASGKPRKFRISPAYRGGPLTVERYNFPVVVDLSGLSICEQSVVANLDHDGSKLVGHVVDVTTDGRQLCLSGIVSGASDFAEQFVDSYDAGFPWHASIEARPTEKPEMIPAGKTVFVNGQSFKGPVLVARRAELYGVSFVPRGADDGTSVSIAARKQKQRAVA